MCALYFVRHGEYLPADVDPKQPLSPYGQKKLDTFGKALEDFHLEISEIFHSGKLRALQTAEILARHFKKGIPISEMPGIKPNDSPDLFISELEHYQNILVVSHLPFLESVLSKLLSAEISNCLRVREGSLFCLEKERSGWVLSWTLHPYLFS